MLLHFDGQLKKSYIEITEVSKMNEINSRRQFTREFKLETVEFLLRGDKPGVEVARDLGIRTELLYHWKRAYLNDKDHSFPGTGHLQNPEEERVRKLEQELRSLTEERDILKKVVAIFSKTPK